MKSFEDIAFMRMHEKQLEAKLASIGRKRHLLEVRKRYLRKAYRKANLWARDRWS